ncbi:hypothetical protein OGM63_01960 [Plectonema radiosum NIES-515]|uniref:Transposase n=1 Tax=Plectonema radiosum NIES-515 TaxID=2986073 RepID=A0ABT3AUP8_9CYAN|nr:hypothetical protein [Plectonema radiosum]MCV3212304.1 hypothetical protein [Plectonema radiosum NIES-515]
MPVADINSHMLSLVNFFKAESLQVKWMRSRTHSPQVSLVPDID